MKLKKSERWFFSRIGLLAYASGVLLFLFSRWIRVESAIGEQHHPAEFWIRVAHSTLTYFVVLSLGYLLSSHVAPHWKTRMNFQFRTGVGILAWFGVLLSTALIILYTGEGKWVTPVSWIHGLAGILSPSLIFTHLRRKKSARWNQDRNPQR